MYAQENYGRIRDPHSKASLAYKMQLAMRRQGSDMLGVISVVMPRKFT